MYPPPHVCYYRSADVYHHRLYAVMSSGCKGGGT
jgi:hypothetical protein